MNASADVLEMQGICSEIADRLSVSSRDKDRVAAIHQGVRKPDGENAFSWNRAFEFLRAKARRVDSWEKDIARRKRDQLRRAQQQQEELEHFNWLASEVGRLRESGEEFHGPHIVALERVLRRAGMVAGAVAIPEAAEREIEASGGGR